MKIVSAVLGGGLVTLYLPTPGTAQYILCVIVNFVVASKLKTYTKEDWNWCTVHHIYVADRFEEVLYASVRPGSKLNY